MRRLAIAVDIRQVYWGCLRNLPFSKSCDAFIQVTPSLEFWIGHCYDGDVGQGVADESAEMLRKAAKGVIASLVELVCKMSLRKGEFEYTLNPWMKHKSKDLCILRVVSRCHDGRVRRCIIPRCFVFDR